MEIRFPADAPAYRDSNLTVVFPALVDGEPVPCAISVEALEDHFGAYSEDLEGWMRAFDAGRHAHRGGGARASADQQWHAGAAQERPLSAGKCGGLSLAHSSGDSCVCSGYRTAGRRRLCRQAAFQHVGFVHLLCATLRVHALPMQPRGQHRTNAGYPLRTTSSRSGRSASSTRSRPARAARSSDNSSPPVHALAD